MHSNWYEIILAADGDPVLDQHRIQGSRIFPGAGYLEAMLATTADPADISGTGLELRRVMFYVPLICPENTATQLRIEHHPSDGDFSIFSFAESRLLRKHMDGVVLNTSGNQGGEGGAPFKWKEVQASLGCKMGPDRFYSRMEQAGLHYGPFFRTVSTVYWNETEAIVELVPWIGNRSDSEWEEYILHPGILDGAFQATSVFSLADPADSLYVPFFIQSLSILSPLPKGCVCHITVLGKRDRSQGIRRYNLKLYDRNGKLSVVIEGLALKSLRTVGDSPAGTAEGTPEEKNRLEPPPTVSPSFLPGSNPEERLTQWISSLLAEVLDVDEGELDGSLAFQEMGLDSIKAADLLSQIELSLDIVLDPLLLFEYSTIQDLAAYLHGQNGATAIEVFGEAVNHDGVTIPKMAAASEFPVAALDERPAGEDPVEAVQVPSSPLISQTPDTPSKGGGNCCDGGIAIIGMAGRFPGAEDVEQYWRNLAEGRTFIESIPESRWHKSEGPGNDEREVPPTRYGAFLRDIDKFDPLFFGVSVNKAALMDPQQRILLQTVWQAVEDAGYANGSLTGSRAGVYIGVCNNEYIHRGKRDLSQLNPHLASGNTLSALANRISYFLDVKGPSMAIDTACSSAMTALFNASRDIMAGYCDYGIVGGVNLTLSPVTQLLFEKSGVLSANGRVCSFDDGASGYVRGEGAGAVLLKPLKKALEDGDNIHAVLKGVAVNHAGTTNGLNTPSSIAEKEVILEACRTAGISPESVTYIEAHGTATPLGDTVEFRGLSDAFRSYTTRRGFCAIGSVKNNIGHLEAASGIAGLIKLILQLKHRQLPPHIHFCKPNRKLQFAVSPFYVNDRLIPWHSVSGPLRAGISSFGFGGANVHAILEEAPERPGGLEDARESPPPILTLSAKHSDSLEAMSLRLAEYLERNRQVSLNQVAYSLNTGRGRYDHRLALPAEDRASAIAALRRTPGSNGLYSSGKSGRGGKPRIAFLFRGPGGKKKRHATSGEWLTAHPFVQNWLYCLGAPELLDPDYSSASFGCAASLLLMDIGFDPEMIVGAEEGVVAAEIAAGSTFLGEADHSDPAIDSRERLRPGETPFKLRPLKVLEPQAPERDTEMPEWIKEQNFDVVIEPMRIHSLSSFAQTVSRGYCAGIDINWNRYYQGHKWPKTSLPTYVFKTKRYWLE
ncbi:beta-ketoacyl synthase N-terminal-like domain-containing protein [Paenibacillus sp. TH7-28]